MTTNQIIQMFEDLPLWAKVVLLIVVGGVISPVYRILKFFETKNTTTLIVGIVCLVTGCGSAILAILDIISEITKGKITLFV